MDFLNHLDDYCNIKKYYDKINNFDETDLKNLYNYININWSKILNEIDDEYYSTIKLTKKSNCSIEEFNESLNYFINDNYTLGIFVINTIERH